MLVTETRMQPALPPPRRVRILYVSNVNAIGGAERSLLDIVDSLAREHFEPLVVVPGPGPLESRLLDSDVRVLHCAGLRRLRRTNRMSLLAQQGAALLRSARSIQRLAGRERVALIHANTTSAALHVIPGMLGAKRCPVIWHVRDLVGGRELHWLARSCDAIIANSRACLTRVPVLRKDIPVMVLASGVRVSGSARAPSKAARLVSIGHAAPWKGHDMILDAAELLVRDGHEFEWLVAGGDPFGNHPGFFDRLRQQVRQRRLDQVVRLLGALDDVSDLLCTARCLVHTAFPEPFGRVIVEAMSVGCPVVAFAGPHGPAELLADGVGGVLVAPRTAEALATTVGYFLSHPTELERVARHAASKVGSKYSSAATATRLASFYQSLSSKGRRRASDER